MSDLAKRIRERGHWEVLVRPCTYQAARITDLPAVMDLMRGVSVQLRGWDFPHVDEQTRPLIDPDRIGQDTEWKHFLELWRVYRSGQFLFVGGMRHDWGAPPELSLFERDIPPGALILGMGDALFRYTEVVEFASRYERAVARGEGVDLAITVAGLKGRRLVVDDRWRTATSMEYVGTTEKPFVQQMRVDEGLDTAALRKTARECSRALFELFRFQANEAMLEDWQGKMRRV